jgi:hypothetical protein
MAGRFKGVSDLAWRLFEDIWSVAPRSAAVGCPMRRFGRLCIRYCTILITDGRWWDVPRGLPWASKPATQRWWRRWRAAGTLAAMPVRILGIADERGMMHGAYGAVDSAVSP